MRNWLKHLGYWLRGFPVGDYHLCAGPVGEIEEHCLVCGLPQWKNRDELAWDSRYLARQPERLLHNAGEALLRRFLANLTRLDDEDLRVIRRMRNALEAYCGRQIT